MHYGDLVLKTKKILLRTTNNLSDKVDNYTHLSAYFLGLNLSGIFGNFFIFFFIILSDFIQGNIDKTKS